MLIIRVRQMTIDVMNPGVVDPRVPLHAPGEALRALSQGPRFRDDFAGRLRE
jgi:hypothetical protein